MKSTIAKSYFTYLKQAAQAGAGNNFILPGSLNFFQNTDGKCEHSIKVSRPLKLEWCDRVETESEFFPDTQQPNGIRTHLSAASFDTITTNSTIFEESDSRADTQAFYDFTKAVRTPKCTVQFTNTRMLQCICILPNKHLLLEGGLVQ